MSGCDDCIKGSLHEGKPAGKIEEINGIRNYVAIPKTDYAKNKAVLILPDVFGISLVNSQLIADAFAENGLQCYLIDYLQGDDVPPDALKTGKFDLPAWFQKHTPAEVRPPTDKTLAGLQERGITDIAATGYCFGGRYVFHLAQDNAIKVGITAHPSHLQYPEDLEKLLAQSKAPILMCGAETDQQYGPERQKLAEEILGNGKYKPGFKGTYAAGCSHGFAVRADLSDPKQKKGKEDAFRDSVAWVKTHL